MDSWMIAAGACVLGLALGAICTSLVRDARERSRARARSLRAKRGEERAARVLTAGGFKVQDRQVRRRYVIEVDGAAREIELILDYVVSRGGETLVAEVKTGTGPTSLQHVETRRQLLEYQLATGSRRVLLVDPEADSISEVAFPIPQSALPPAARKNRVLWPLTLAGLIGFGVLIWQLRSC
jgi:Holliday junction resolvase-like predicted endonuclease